MAVCVSGKTPVDWPEVQRLASLPDFDVADDLERLRKEVAHELGIAD